MKKREGGVCHLSSAVGARHPVVRLCAVLSGVEREWPRIVGDALARRSFPDSYEEGVLTIAVDGPSAMQDMNFKKNAIMRELQAKAGLRIEAVKIELGFKRGEIPSRTNRSYITRLPAARAVDPLKEEKLTSEILAEYEDIAPETARSIARCRLMSER
ncbi:hypothetical protein FACS1894216_14310 [Synergistales bacterium]|nr:hypothetical protein FACS1894216_14310 [Synergistales bacterium]